MLEVLTKQDGVTVKKLSHRKLLLEYEIPVYLGNTDIVVSILNSKFRYVDDGVGGYMRLDNGKYIRALSMKFGVKMTQLRFDTIVNYKLDNIGTFGVKIIALRITDDRWIRDYKLKIIMSE